MGRIGPPENILRLPEKIVWRISRKTDGAMTQLMRFIWGKATNGGHFCRGIWNQVRQVVLETLVSIYIPAGSAHPERGIKKILIG